MGARFSAPVQTGPGAHPASFTMGTASFPGVKDGRGVTLAPRPLLVPWSRRGRTPPMGRTACTEPQCLYKGALYLFTLFSFRDCTRSFQNSRYKNRLHFCVSRIYLHQNEWLICETTETNIRVHTQTQHINIRVPFKARKRLTISVHITFSRNITFVLKLAQLCL